MVNESNKFVHSLYSYLSTVSRVVQRHKTSVAIFALSSICGWMVSLVYAPHNHGLLLFISIPFLYIVTVKFNSIKSAIINGYAFSFFYLFSNLVWIPNALNIDSSLTWLKPIALLFMPMYLSIFSICPILILYLNRKSHCISRISSFALAWVLFEYFRVVGFFGFSMNLIGYAVSSSDILSQTASLIGIYGLSFLVIFIASIPAEIILSFNIRRCISWLAVGSCMVCILSLFGMHRLAHAPIGYDYSIKLRVVQGGMTPYQLWRTQYMQNALVRRYLELSLNEGYEHITHFIWGEGTLPLVVDINASNFLPLVRDFPANSFLLTGSSRLENGRTDLFNSWIAIESATGKVQAYYDKGHLVPFGEFLPFRGILARLLAGKFINGIQDYSEGDLGISSISLTNTPDFHVVICYETMFMGKTLNALRDNMIKNKKIKWILNVANDGWFGQSQGPYQHLAVSKIRAIESGLPLVRSANTGISAVYDGYGRLISHLPLDTSDIMDVYLPKGSSRTLISYIYSYAPNAWIALLCLVSLIVVLDKRHIFSMALINLKWKK